MLKSLNKNRTLFWTGWLLLVLIGLSFTIYLSLPYFYRTGSEQLPVNFVAIDERLATSGQPSVMQLKQLHLSGYQVVINLAPVDSYLSIEEEADYLSATNVHYINLPVDFDQPGHQDFIRFSRLIQQYRSKKILVHCQANYRASSFVFLYRVVHEDIDATKAYEDVTKVWIPNPRWANFLKMELQASGIKDDELF